jgi:hypothetical protein
MTCSVFRSKIENICKRTSSLKFNYGLKVRNSNCLYDVKYGHDIVSSPEELCLLLVLRQEKGLVFAIYDENTVVKLLISNNPIIDYMTVMCISSNQDTVFIDVKERC